MKAGGKAIPIQESKKYMKPLNRINLYQRQSEEDAHRMSVDCSSQSVCNQDILDCS